MLVTQLHTLVNTVTQEVLGESAVVNEDLSNVVDIGKAVFDANKVDNYVKKLVDHIGHGELIPLAGFFLALGAYELFEFVNIKGDLGALLAGMYLASHKKSSEINKSLMGFKDLFLIGFFLSIGFAALPTWEMLAIAAVLTLLIPVKFLLFFYLWPKCPPTSAKTTILKSYSFFSTTAMTDDIYQLIGP